MRVTLLHKPSAGDGTHTRTSLIALFERHDHTVRYHALDDDWPVALDAPTDCLVVAGGDGAVASVAKRLVDRSMPLAILPLGTANNIALRLGLCHPIETLVARLAEAKPIPFDLITARGPWGVRRLVEGVGVGAFTQVMAFLKSDGKPEQGKRMPDPPMRAAELGRDLRLLQTFLRNLDPHRCTLGLDGESKEVSYLLLEVTNTGLIGPNVELAPEADCGDGLLDVVVIGQAERQRLREYLEACLVGEEVAPPPFPVRRAKTVRLTVEAARLHIDGDLWPGEDESPPAAPFDLKIQVEPGALAVLVPT